MITSIYASTIGLFLIVLSMRVIALRGNPIFSFLKFQRDSDISLERAIRGHGNLVEYSPIFLILFYLLETNNLNTTHLHIIGIIYLIGRLMHGICFSFMTKNMFLRVVGTAITLFSIGYLSILTLIRF